MLTFQEAISRLQDYWASQGALLWQPYSEKVGAGTYNPATILRVLGPETWNVAYVEPSFRADDGRYGDNPNRMQMHTQMQVILKPDPGDPIERYLASLEALGIRREEHDIRFVEDNWESPLIGAWGLGWEVWLDGQEITQFTYFQQAGGLTLDIPAVEITYGLERIILYLQKKRSVWDIEWDATHTYGEILLDQEIDYCRYNFDIADVGRLWRMYELYEAEALLALDLGLVVPALDYILRCSQTFNLLDSRGAIGVTERAALFKGLRDLTRQIASVYLQQRERAGLPWKGRPGLTSMGVEAGTLLHLPLGAAEPCESECPEIGDGYVPFQFEIGVEELPASHLSGALAQLRQWVPETLDELRLAHGEVQVWGTPRRLAVHVDQLAISQPSEDKVFRGPPARAAFDADGAPTRAAQGFARSRGVDVSELTVEDMDGGQYVVARARVEGRRALDVLAEELPGWIAKLRFPKTMRWNQTGVAFSRPIRWLTALLGEDVVPFLYAGLASDRITVGPRPAGSPRIALASAADYRPSLASYGVVVDVDARQAAVLRQAQDAAQDAAGSVPDDPALVAEVANLVEVPMAILGSFEPRYLDLPSEVLIAVMKKHQRYFPVLDADGKMMANFVTIRNGGREHVDLVRQGNEDVIRARYADAEFFYTRDQKRPLATYRKGLEKLTFQADLGSMLDKTDRLHALAPWIGQLMGLGDLEIQSLKRAAYLCKADLATSLVIEMTSLQGTMGREYALISGEKPAVADAIAEHYLPRSSGEAVPSGNVGTVLAIADRVDSLVGLFAVGMAPTGSADPYGLRRAAAGLVQILLEKQLDLPLRTVVAKALDQLPVDAPDATLDKVLQFVAGRLEGALRDAGLAHDVVAAALAERGGNPTKALESAEQLSAWVRRDDWSLLLDNYARCVRITRGKPAYAPAPSELVEAEEKALFAALLEAESAAASDVDGLLAAFEPMVSLIQAFFDKVLVMAEDDAVRESRLGLLQSIAGLAKGIADLSRLEGF